MSSWLPLTSGSAYAPCWQRLRGCLLGLPAGHVDLGETPTACVVGEELSIGLDPASLRPGSTMFRAAGTLVDIFSTPATWTGTPEIREPHKCAELVWADPDPSTS